MATDKEQRIKDLEQQIADLRSRLPAHSVKPEMLNKTRRIGR